MKESYSRLTWSRCSQTAPRSSSPAEGSFPWCKWKIAKKCSQRASEMRSFHIVQGSCKRSGWVSKVLMIDLKGNVSGPAQKKMGREVALHCLSAIYGFPLYFFITHTQTICNRLVPCVSIMFTSYPRSFLPISTCPPSCRFS